MSMNVYLAARSTIVNIIVRIWLEHIIAHVARAFNLVPTEEHAMVW